MNDYDPDSISVEEALCRINTGISPITAEEKISLRSALGRILAEDIRSSINVPSHANSAMDGYAVSSSDLPISDTRELKIIGVSRAGKNFTESVRSGQCIRIMTGALLPAGADTIIMQEQVERQGEAIRIGAGHKPGQNVRRAGEDITVGQTVLSTGKLITPAELGILASLGVTEIKVKRRLRVSFFSTGDELRAVDESLSPGQIHDSNRYTLLGMLTRLGIESHDLGVVRDSRERITEALLQAANVSDAVITSGGVSVGETDYVKETLEAIGQVNFWKIAMKPGRPLAFGKIGNALFFGLPGNPVSVMTTFYQFVQPALRHMMGQSTKHAMLFKVPCATRLKKSPGRMEFQRGVLEYDTAGALVVRSTGEQGSGILSSMSLANCFIALSTECAGVETGDIVEVQLFEGLI